MTKPSTITQGVLTVTGALFLTGGMVRADVDVELSKLFANDGVASDDFGRSQGVSGTTLIVGAPFDDDNGVDSGCAYLFDTATGGQIAKLLPSDGVLDDYFGHAVAISGTTAIVGAYKDDDNGIDSGSAYLFDTTTGLQIAKLLPTDGASGDAFGYAVAIKGSTAVVGAYLESENGDEAGCAYVFDTTTGMQTAKLLANDGGLGDTLGYSVAIDGTTAIVGAPISKVNSSPPPGIGAAYLFDTTTGLQVEKLEPTGSTTNSLFGRSVGISGTTAIVGAEGENVTWLGAGAAYLFDTTSGVQLSKLVADDGSFLAAFGSSVSISGKTGVVGARGGNGDGVGSGAAYLFDTEKKIQISKMIATDGSGGDRLGVSAVISGSTAFVGAPQNDGNASETGSVYLFDARLHALCGDVPTISLTSGGTQTLSIEGGIENAGSFYFMFGSATGTSPGINFGGGVVLPLNFDAYLSLTLTRPGLGAFGNFRGVLDGNGNAVATLTFPSTANVLLVGVELNHAFLAAEVFGVADFASNAVSVQIVL